MKNRKMRGGNSLTNIQTGNKNLETLKMLSMPKPPLQPLGQIVRGLQGSGKKRKRQRGGFYVDRYGTFIHNY